MIKKFRALCRNGNGSIRFMMAIAIVSSIWASQFAYNL